MICLITGGTSGVGQSLVSLLAEQGHIIYAVSRSARREDSKGNVHYLPLDVTSQSDTDAAIAEIMQNEATIDVLINCAGIGLLGPAEAVPIDEIDHMFNVNFTGVVRLTQAVLPIMRAAGHGLIINISSLAGSVGLPFRSYYSASKAALDVFTEALRLEVKPFHIQAVSIQLGDVRTAIAENRYEVPKDKQSVYNDDYERVREIIIDEVEKACEPDVIAKKLIGIIERRVLPSKICLASGIARFVPILKRILPSWLWEKLIANSYKL